MQNKGRAEEIQLQLLLQQLIYLRKCPWRKLDYLHESEFDESRQKRWQWMLIYGFNNQIFATWKSTLIWPSLVNDAEQFKQFFIQIVYKSMRKVPAAPNSE